MRWPRFSSNSLGVRLRSGVGTFEKSQRTGSGALLVSGVRAAEVGGRARSYGCTQPTHDRYAMQQREQHV
eukprot:scaffold25349_cov37-Tisochrysis_lutea.AAC.1